MESSRPKEKRKTDEHITPVNGDRHEKNGQELDEIRKEGPGQSGCILKNNYKAEEEKEDEKEEEEEEEEDEEEKQVHMNHKIKEPRHNSSTPTCV
ncbi:unnamed protein product [Schistosoma margrebowiei]|uniref:Uncharacterized protein n=1 Tax=Schistosoma margrebowiei TaxID=48269 RepID=A0A183MR59_9TREM|nr:unnamed protein product [Schistosoma margrebowiei]